MNYCFIKIFFIMLTACYICIQVIPLSLSKIHYILFSALIPINSLISYYLNAHTSIPYAPVCIIIYFALILFFLQLPMSVAMTTAMLTYTIGYGLYSLVSMVLILPFVLVVQYNAIDMMFLITCLTGIITFTLTVFFMRIKKIQKGLQRICFGKMTNWGFLISALILLGITLAQIFHIATTEYRFFAITILFLIILLLCWFQLRTNKYYRNKLRALELESLQQELAEKDALIQKLQDNNDSLARIIHKDNKLIPAMEAAVSEYLTHMTSDLSDGDGQIISRQALDQWHEHGAQLSEQLKDMAKDRRGILGSYENQRSELPRTGHAATDAILSYMHDRAAEFHIQYTVQISSDFAGFIDQTISEEDLVHLLSDLIDNAIIAAKDSSNRSILVRLGALSTAAAIEISDSGTPFEPAVYQDFGMRRHSTHLDGGGSGIGLMDIWELKKKYSASLHIYEYAPDTELYTKKLSIIFDSKNHYLIRSCRAQEITMLQARTDLFVLPPE